MSNFGGKAAGPQQATCWAGPKCHTIHYPLSDWKVFNLVVTYQNDVPGPAADRAIHKVFIGGRILVDRGNVLSWITPPRWSAGRGAGTHDRPGPSHG